MESAVIVGLFSMVTFPATPTDTPSSDGTSAFLMTSYGCTKKVSCIGIPGRTEIEPMKEHDTDHMTWYLHDAGSHVLVDSP